ncbi:ABC transporter permease [Spirochaeta dissipatitropha]
MLRDAYIIFSKEFRNVFKDKRAIFSNYVLPLLLMPVLFIGIEFFTSRQITEAQERVYPIHLVNSPGTDFEQIMDQYLLFDLVDEGYNRETLTVAFPRGYSPGDQAIVEVYADSTSTPFSMAAQRVEAAVREYNQQIASERLTQAGVQPGELESISLQRIDVAPPEAQGSSFLAMMLPYLLLIYIFAGSMAMGMNITAGEKERGGFAILLVNQVSRSSIALGKIFFLVASAMISSISSAVGIILAVRFNPAMFGAPEMGAGMAMFNLGGVISLLLTVLTAGGVSAALIVLLGSLSRNMKEASGYISPMYIVVILAGVVTMNLDATSNLALFGIPLINLIFMLKGIITSQYTLLQLLVTVGANTAALAVLVYATSRLYNSERVLNTGA